MKLGITGNYGHSNLGDEALLQGAVELAHTHAGLAEEDIVVLSDNRADTQSRLAAIGCEVRQLRRPFGGNVFRLPFVVKDIFVALKGLDWLVFGGGGLLNDSNRTAIPLFVVIRVLAWLRGIRVAWWSVGIGPLDAPVHKRLAAWLLSSSSFVTVRDEDSARMAARMFARSFKVTPDLAHAVPVPVARRGSEQRVIAISVIPYQKAGSWFEANDDHYTHYCEKMVAVIRQLLNARDDILVRLFPVSLEQDTAAIEDICAAGDFAREDRVETYHPTSVQSLLDELRGATVVLATRLHSVVLASLAGVPSITIAYQPKVASYATELPSGLPCFNIDKFSADEVAEACLQALERVGAIIPVLRSENEERHSRLSRAIKSWKELK